MDNIILDLVKFDKAAQKLVDDALLERQQADTVLQDEKKRVYDEYLSKANERIEKYKAHVRAENDERFAQVLEAHKNDMQKLQSLFEKNRNDWVDTLYKRCVTIGE